MKKLLHLPGSLNHCAILALGFVWDLLDNVLKLVVAWMVQPIPVSPRIR
jgi:hypothetical protein